MIQVAEREEQRKKLLELCQKSAFGCKIASIATAYGFDKKFSCFWKEQDSNAVYCLVDDVMIISGTPKNAEETNMFLKMVGAKEIMCALRGAEKLSMPMQHQGDVLQKKLEFESGAFVDTSEVNIREIYFLLEECGMETDFEAFYMDLSHRLRHEAALVVTEYQESQLVGCAVVSSITDTAAILSAVAVKESFRRKGIASELIKQAEAALGGKTIYIFKEKGLHEEFYKQLGYHKADTWVNAPVE
ncbi:GNAT family N-acetyltransferase [Scatolibacter rhodanostii]|uniref:GNAT family N-acetyltransferase n=1 Tax=Scatolibacter rhodanostii TaxID=2014781 RepID=UPI000C085504|nr:GNAT family N-acetyltransferase [Scatolibacter rhodanostii]